MHSTLKWHHNECVGVSNHQPHECLLNCLSRRWSKKTSKLRVTGLCAGSSPVAGEFPAQRASYVKMFPFDDIIMKLFCKMAAILGGQFRIQYAGSLESDLFFTDPSKNLFKNACDFSQIRFLLKFLLGKSFFKGNYDPDSMIYFQTWHYMLISCKTRQWVLFTDHLLKHKTQGMGQSTIAAL